MSEAENGHIALSSQLSWFIRLRWIAGGTVVLAALVDHCQGDWWSGLPLHIGAVGAVILVYNATLRVLIRPAPSPRRGGWALTALTWGQIAIDLACLTLVTLWTGGPRSPVLGFFVFHMVITSLLLPHLLAYIAVLLSGILLTGGLWFTGQWPTQQADALILLGWMMTLLITVYLTSKITDSLRRHQLRGLKQDQRLQSMSDRLRRQQRAMIQQDKMAALGQLAAGVAHEIGNPLACMDSLLALIERKPDRMNTETPTKLRDQINRISSIIKDLTDFAHPAQGQWRRTSVNEVVARTMQMVRFDRRARDVEMEIRQEAPPGDAWVSAQPHALEQVLVNLTLNALDAMAEIPKPKMLVGVWRNGDQCFIRVADNGPGIEPEHMKHLFEPFFTTKPVGKGTGLGLAISYRLVRSHGGQIEVDSTSEGATFTICLPAQTPVG